GGRDERPQGRRHRRRCQRARHGGAARPRRPRRHAHRAPRRRGRPRRPLAPGRVRVRHRTVLVPHARGLRSLLPPDVGTTTSDELDLVRLDPAYRVYGERAPGSPTSRIDVRSGTREATALFEQREPGAGRALERYLRSATRAHHAAREAFLYNTFASPRSLLSA